MAGGDPSVDFGEPDCGRPIPKDRGRDTGDTGAHQACQPSVESRATRPGDGQWKHRGFGRTVHSAASPASVAGNGAPAFTASVASDNPRARQMTEGADDRVADAIRERAGEVEELGAYIGFYEWCAFAVKYSMRVEMLFGTSIVDVAAVFAPEMPFEHAHTARVCAVRCGDGGRLLSATPEEQGALPRTNHFVIGVPAKGCAGADAAAGAEATPASVPLPACARAQAMAVHWVLLPTAAQGDCGIDTMTHFLHRPRSPEGWAAVRHELADFMREHADEAKWQTIFGACQEREPAMTTSAATALRTGGLGPPVLAEALRPAPPAKAPLPEASSPAHTPMAALADAPGPGPPAQAAEAEASSPGSAAQSDGPLVASADGGRQSFAEWMSSLPPAELMRLTESLDAFAEAEAQWMTRMGDPTESSQGPRRAHRSSKVSFKLATGFAYLEWRAGAGSNTRSPLKDP